MNVAGKIYQNFDFKKWSQIILFLALGIIVFYLLKKFGIIPSREQREQEQKEKESENLTNYNYFDPNFFVDYAAATKRDPKIIENPDNIKRYCQVINDAIGVWPFNSPAAIFSVFSELQYQTQVSYLSFMYARLYARDLGNDLTKVLSDSDRVKLVEKIDNMQIS